MKKQLICIVCPNGCEITAEMQDGNLFTEGAQCKRGREYVEQEMTNPVRTLSTSVSIEDGEFPLVSVRLNGPIPKSQIFDFMRQIKTVCLKAPVHIGQIVLSDVCGSGNDAIVTKNIARNTGK